MYFFPTVVIDDFFKEPLKVRDYALTMEFGPRKNFSGTRTVDLFNVNPFFANNVCRKLLESSGIPVSQYKAEVHFHLTGKEFGAYGWPHMDYEKYDGSMFASVIYLTPISDGLNSGTSLFKIKNFQDTSNSAFDMQSSFTSGIDDVEKKEKYMSNFEETIRIGGSFNRAVSYDARRPHCGNGYFGETKEEQRLTMLVFFKEIITSLPRGHSPILYAEMMSEI